METFKKTFFSGVILFFATALVVVASTTIGTSIDTGGNLTVTGTSTLSGKLIIEDAIQGVTGANQPRVVFTDNDLTVYGEGTVSPILNITDTVLSLFSSDESSDVTVRDNSVSLSSGFSSITVNGSSDSVRIIGSGGINLPSSVSFSDEDVTIDAISDLSTVNITLDSSSGGNIQFDSTGGGAVLSNVPFGIPSSASLATCNTTIAPIGHVVLAWDTTGPDLCVCDGTSWAPVDGSGTCA